MSKAGCWWRDGLCPSLTESKKGRTESDPPGYGAAGAALVAGGATFQGVGAAGAKPAAAQPEEIAEAIMFLLGEASSYMTGAIVDVSGGR